MIPDHTEAISFYIVTTEEAKIVHKSLPLFPRVLWYKVNINYEMNKKKILNLDLSPIDSSDLSNTCLKISLIKGKWSQHI